jgi:hypothetical protein
MKMTDEVRAKVDAVLRQAAPPKETAAPPIMEQTRREMAAGARYSDFWKAQQKLRPPPSARDIAAAGSVDAAISASIKPPK